MNPFTAPLRDVLRDSPEFREQLTAIIQREYKPFLAGEQAFQANARILEGHSRAELDTWYEWLPDTPINRIGGGLAVEMPDSIAWAHLARLAREYILPTNLRALAVPHPGSTT